MRTARLLALTVALGAVAAGPVLSPDAGNGCFLVAGEDTPDDETDDVEACRQDVWFHEADTKVDNLDHAADEPVFTTWDTTPPAASVTEGAGSGVLTTSVLHQQAEAWDARESFVAAGEFVGAIDNVVVELYMFRPGLTPSFNTGDPGSVGQTTVHSVDAVLYVDGYPVANLADVDAELHPAGQAAERITFAFRDLANTLANNARFSEVPLDGTHTVEVRTHGTGIGSDAAVVVYDTTEVPSGLVFNASDEVLAEVD